MKKLGMMAIVGLCLFFLSAPAPAQDQDEEQGIGQGGQAMNMKTYVELMRTNLRAQKKQLLTQSMELNEEQSRVFWPIYNDYEHDLSRLTDKGLAIIMDYSKNYQNMTDKVAHDLMTRALDNQTEKLKLKKVYGKKMEKALSSKVAARFLQADGVISKMIELQIDSQLPLIK